MTKALRKLLTTESYDSEVPMPVQYYKFHRSLPEYYQICYRRIWTIKIIEKIFWISKKSLTHTKHKIQKQPLRRALHK